MTLCILGTRHSRELKDYWVIPAQTTTLLMETHTLQLPRNWSWSLLSVALPDTFSGTHLYSSLQIYYVLSVPMATGLPKPRLQRAGPFGKTGLFLQHLLIVCLQTMELSQTALPFIHEL